MKAVAVILAALLSVSMAGPADVIREMIESLRDRMPCGIPEYNLPILAPFLLDTFGYETWGPSLGLSVQVDDLRLDGLNKFEIDDLTFNLLAFRATFGFTFEGIRLQTKYNLDAHLAGLAKLFGNGTIDFALDKLTLKGNLALLFSPDGSCSLKELKIAMDLDQVQSNITGLMGNEIVGGFLNDILTSTIMAFVKENADFVSETLEGLVTPLGNGLLANITVKDILEWINGGSGGEPGPTPEPCVPPTETSFLYGIN